MNSWELSDSTVCPNADGFEDCTVSCLGKCPRGDDPKWNEAIFCIGPNDLSLMKKLIKSGSDHRKFMRQIFVSVDITAPLYWWKEFDTYKVGTVANSCSTMHKIHEKEFTLDDFSHEHLSNDDYMYGDNEYQYDLAYTYIKVLRGNIFVLNVAREQYLKTRDKKYWWQMIQLLPSSYNQKRTVTLNYENLFNMYHARKNHKLDEWRTLCEWIESLPYAKELIGEQR